MLELFKKLKKSGSLTKKLANVTEIRLGVPGYKIIEGEDNNNICQYMINVIYCSNKGTCEFVLANRTPVVNTD